MDTDFIDIKRDIDGKLQEVYSNIACHLEMSSADNPDPLTIDLKPIVQTVIVHMPIWVDVQNNDFIVAKKMNSNGEIIQVYSGRCGNPATDQSRKKVIMTMNATDSDTPTPPPPLEPAEIIIEYKYGDSDLISPSIESAQIGSSITISATQIEGYTVSGYKLDGGELIEGSSVVINPVSEEGHLVTFVYAQSTAKTYMRYLVNGLYTKDDGSLSNGLHLYKKIPISVNQNIITISAEPIYHEDAGMFLTPDVDQKMVLYPGEDWVKFKEYISRSTTEIAFEVVPYSPTQAEQNAYVTGWYD